jgi:acetyl esterase/lipase
MGLSRTNRNGATTSGGRTARALTALGLLAVLALLGAPGASAAQRMAATTGTAFDNVAYGGEAEQLLDIYPASQTVAARGFGASSGAGSPVVVLVHGGGWRTQTVFTLRNFRAESRSLQEAGFTVFTIDYRQDSSEVAAFPMEPQDVLRAVHWAVDHAASYGGDPNQLVLVGGSAGGQLVAVVAEQLAASNPGLVKGVVTLSGPFSFPQIREDFRNETITSENFKASVHMALKWWGGRFPMAFAEEWSPALHAPTANCPDWLLFNSEAELIPADQASEMQNNLTAAGCSSQLDVLPGNQHAFEYWSQVEPQVASFIAAH